MSLNWILILPLQPSIELFNVLGDDSTQADTYRPGACLEACKVQLGINAENVIRVTVCCDMGQNDTISKIELNPSFVLSSDNTNYKNDIQLFPQLFDELRVHRDYH